MTPEEMRQGAQDAVDDTDVIINAIWLAAAEICERLDAIAERMEEKGDANRDG